MLSLALGIGHRSREWNTGRNGHRKRDWQEQECRVWTQKSETGWGRGRRADSSRKGRFCHEPLAGWEAWTTRNEIAAVSNISLVLTSLLRETERNGGLSLKKEQRSLSTEKHFALNWDFKCGGFPEVSKCL